MSSYCPICDEIGVPPCGPKNAKILLVGELPGSEELSAGRPFVGPTGKVFKAELRHVGIEFNLCRVANLWLHPMAEPEDKTKNEKVRVKTLNEKCQHYALDIVLDEAKDREAILLVGSECANVFLGMGVMEVCGLQVESPMLSCDTIFAMPNPALVFQEGRGVGEIRLALKRFADACDKKGLLNDEED